MSESAILQMVIQAGAVGISLLLIWRLDSRLDAVGRQLSACCAELRALVEQHRSGSNTHGVRRD